MRASTVRPIRGAMLAMLVLLLCAVGTLAVADGAFRADGRRERPIAGVQIEPSRTRVSLARVNLVLGELRPEGDDLVGNFEINVPMLPLVDDRGTVRIHVPGSLHELARRGAVLDGIARSQSGQVNAVRCALAPDGSVTISITTPRRTLSFDTRYRMLSGGA